MPSRPAGIRLSALAVLLCLAGAAPAQDAAPPPPEPGAQTPATIHPGVQLGRRASVALAGRGVIPVVVIVPDPAAYAEAIGAWAPGSIFPVLIDDGGVESREDIARFVRGFEPRSVVRWGGTGQGAGAPMRARRAVPRARELADAALPAAWDFEAEPGAEPAGALVGHWVEERRHVPAGLVVADERDPAWTAALALAAARGQPLVWAELPNLVIDQALAPAGVSSVCGQIEAACERSRLPWRGLGDAIDAVTICARLPARYETAPKEFSATTDRLGRFADGSRWAWAGQVFGSEPQAAYRAMCSIFLGVGSAWLFDGYGSGEPWVRWDATAAAEQLKPAGIFTMVDDEPQNRVDDWKLRCERPVRAELICLNSSGNRAWFDIGGTRAWSGDLPLLEVPAAVHMVHSWSAAAPGQPVTIAGRWFERGVFAYAGSVHEPYLQAFVPTPMFATRMVAGMAFGSAARVDESGPWRVAILGDPLLSYGPRPERLEDDVPLEGAEGLADALKSAAGEQRYAAMYTLLSLQGRDADLARLFGAMLRDEPQELNAEVAVAALFALFRAGADDAFIRAYALLPEEIAGSVNAVDALWHVGRRVAREGSDFREAAFTLMSAHPRDRQADVDAAELRRLGG